MNKLFGWISAASLLAMLHGCESKTEVIDPTTDLIVTVLNASGAAQPQARVALFDDEATFLVQNDNFGTNGAVRVADTDSIGTVRFDSLRTDVNYYILAFTTDSVTYRNEGYRLHNDNSSTGFRFLRTLNKSSVTRATLQLRPADALVSFFANDFNTDALPIKIFVRNDSVGVIDQIRTDVNSVPINPASNPVQNGVITRVIRLGVNPTAVRFVNSFECNNISSLNIIGGNFNRINVNNCTAGVVTFWTDTRNAGNLPISIYINGTNLIGRLTTPLRNPPATVKAPNVLNYVLEPGNYFYVATAPGCLWKNEFTVQSNQYTVIPLSPCN